MFVTSTTIKNYLTANNMSYVDNEEMSLRFWKSIDVKLKECHMSRTELAKRAKLSPQSLTPAKYLKSNLTIFTALRITKALGCTIEDLIYDHTDQKSHRNNASTQVKINQEDVELCGISALSELFNDLTNDEQLAVLVHVFSVLGISVKKTMEKIDAVSIEGEGRRGRPIM